MVLGGYPQNSTNAPKACCHSRCASGRAILKRAGLPIVSGRKQAGEGGTATEVCPTVQQILKSIRKWPEVADFRRGTVATHFVADRPVDLVLERFSWILKVAFKKPDLGAISVLVAILK